ncbi:hypothetical protein [Nonomuraea sp. NPDC049028]|uniref:hypothetical protein n=1 Tax=Nonomuraea sp. NPDC049028 TaxID=3364348 RepID=UPI003724A73F
MIRSCRCACSPIAAWSRPWRSRRCSGRAYLPLTLLNIVGTKVAERPVTRAGMRAALSTGLLIGTAGMILLAVAVSAHSPFIAVVAALALGRRLVQLGELPVGE